MSRPTAKRSPLSQSTVVPQNSTIPSTDKDRSTKTLATTPKRSQKAILAKAFPEFIERVASGEPVKNVLRSLHIHWPTLQRALESRPDWRVKYNRARKDCAEYWVSEIVPMSDAVIGEEMNVVTATRNAVDARKWVAGKLAPREYGDQPAGVTINNTTNVAIMTDDRLRALQETRKRLFLEQSQSPTLPA